MERQKKYLVGLVSDPSQDTVKGKMSDLDNYQSEAPRRKNREYYFEALLEEVVVLFATPS